MSNDQKKQNDPVEKKHRKPFFNQNAGIFFICIALASIFWLLINLSNKFESTIDVPVEYKNFPYDKVLTKELPSQLVLSVMAPGWDLMTNAVRQENTKLSIDLSNYEISKYINTSSFNSEISGQLPTDFTLLSISPTLVQISMEDKKSKKVPVMPVLNLTFAPQHDISGSVVLEPDSIVVAGAESFIKEITSWKTKPIVEKDVSTDLNKTITLEPVENISMAISSESVKCYIPVGEFTEKTFSYIPIELINCDQDEEIMIYPNSVDITFQVSMKAFDKITSSQFQVGINCSEIDLLNSEKAEITVISQPEFIRSLIIKPAMVDFIIYK